MKARSFFDADEIIPGLYQGAHPYPHDPLRAFDFVVGLSHEKSASGPKTIQWPIDDGPMPDEDRVRWVAEQVNEKLLAGKHVLVHCDAGLNRSGLIVAMTLLHRGWDPQKAVQLIRRKRDPMALCNPDFERWLYRQGPSVQADLAEQEEVEA